METGGNGLRLSYDNCIRDLDLTLAKVDALLSSLNPAISDM